MQSQALISNFLLFFVGKHWLIIDLFTDITSADPLIDARYDFLIDESATSFSKCQLQMMQLRKLLLLYLDALIVYKVRNLIRRNFSCS